MASTKIDERLMDELIKEFKSASGSSAVPAKDDRPTTKTAKVVEEPIFHKRSKELKGMTFYEHFGWTPVFGDFNVTLLNEGEIPKILLPFIPEIDTRYVLPKEETAILTYGIERGKFINLVGPTGSGKSSLVEQICAHLRRPFIRFNGRGDMETASILGQLVVSDGATIWKDGTFTEAVKYGAVVLFDEYTATPPEINLSLQWLREHGGKLFLTDKPGDSSEKIISPHKEFRLVCADNTRGLGDGADSFAGTQVQNTASLNRFDITVELGYLSPEHELSVIKNRYPNLTDKLGVNMIKLANLVRAGYDQGKLSITLSPRNLISWADMAIDFEDQGRSFKYCYFNLLPNDEERTAVRGWYHTVFGSNL